MSDLKENCLKAGVTDNLISVFHKLPLKYISLRKVAILLCGHAKVLKLVEKSRSKPEYSVYGIDEEVESMAKKILPKIFLPKTMNEEMISLLKPICREIFKWFYFHAHFFRYDSIVNILQQLRWTPLGTIDYLKTARLLARYKKLDVRKRYRIACQYCIYGRIRILWKKLPRKYIEEMLLPYEKGHIEHYDIKKTELDVFWAYIMERKVDELKRLILRGPRYSSIYQCAFESVAVQGYIVATRCFFEKLTPAEKEMSLLRTVDEVARKRTFDFVNYKQEYQKYSDVLFYLVSVMEPNQLKHILRVRPFEILKCCLDWPRQNIFVDVAKHVVRYLKSEDYSRLLFILAKNSTSGYHYSEIFQKFLLITPRHLKKYSLNRYGLFLKYFFFVEDVETVKFIFRNLITAEKETLVFNISSRICCYQLVKNERWHLLKLFLREAMLSQDHKARFPKAVADCFPQMEPDNYEALVSFVNSIEESNQISSKCDKANLPSSEESPPKKLKVA